MEDQNSTGKLSDLENELVQEFLTRRQPSDSFRSHVFTGKSKKKVKKRRIAVVGTYRLFILGREKKANKVAKDIHFYDIVNISIDGEYHKIISIELKGKNNLFISTPRAKELVAAILNYYQSISFDFPEEFKLQCITMQPTEPPGKPSIANGYLDIYKACCDYFKLRPNSEFMFHIEDLVDSGSIDLDLSECPGLDFKSLGFGVGLDMLPIMVALHHNTYFRGVVIRNAFGRKEIFHLLADVLKVNTHITKVKLNDVSGEEKGFYDLVVALKENKGHSVQILDLRGNSATNKGATMLGETLKSFPHALRMLNLARCNIASKGIVSLIAAWEENFGTSLCLEELDLSENSFDKAGSAALESWMSNVKLLSNLRVLRLSNSNLVVNVIPSLHSLRNLVELDLSGNKIDSGEGCRIIGFVCDHIPTLQVLRISRCQITKDGIEIIADSICRNSELKIITLDISDNIFGDKGASILANKLNKVNPIQFLNISGNKMKPRTFEELAQACSNLQSLNTFVARRIFSLITHKIPPAASNMISSGLHKICERVKELDIAEGYGKTVLVPIFESLATNTNLKSLNVSCNGLGDKGIEILCAALRKNSSLTQLNVDDNKLTLTGFKILQKLFVRNTNLLTHTYPRGEIEKLITTLETPQKKELHFMTSLLASRLNANELISNKNFDQQLIQLCIYGKKDDTIPTPTSIKPREIIPEYLNQRRTTLSPDVVPDRTTSMERIVREPSQSDLSESTEQYDQQDLPEAPEVPDFPEDEELVETEDEEEN